jgi:hypothetical protein
MSITFAERDGRSPSKSFAIANNFDSQPAPQLPKPVPKPDRWIANWRECSTAQGGRICGSFQSLSRQDGKRPFPFHYSGTSPTAVSTPSPRHSHNCHDQQPFPFHIFMPMQTAVLTHPLVIPHKLNQPAVFHFHNFC